VANDCHPSIARIAKRIGYRDASRFGQHFKRLFEATLVESRTTEQGG
jgi:transcriptional regulator GlxA family with amidase domain